MRWQHVISLAALAACLSGCGNRHLVVNVDVLSYIDPAFTNVEFGPVPAVPGGVATGETELAKDVDVNIVETGSVAEVQRLLLRMSVLVADSTGSGADTLRLYLGDAENDPRSSPAVLTLPITLRPGVTETVTGELDGDERVMRLFQGKQLRMTFTNSMRGPESGDDLNARLRITAIDATLVAGRKGT